MKRFYRRHRKVINVIAIVLVTALVMGIIATSTSLISKVSNSNIGGFRERNDDNLVDVSKYEDLDGTKKDGISIEVSEDGVITLDGTARKDTSISLGSHTIHAESSSEHWAYISGCLDGSLDTYYIEGSCSATPTKLYQLNDNTNVYYHNSSSGGNDGMTLSIIIKDGTDLNNVKIYPAIFEEADSTYFNK